jgi:hypothetical protein
MEFKTLSNTSTEDILSVFNLSFSDYIVPFHLSIEQLTTKIAAEKINPDISVGAFEDDVGWLDLSFRLKKLEVEKKLFTTAGPELCRRAEAKGW